MVTIYWILTQSSIQWVLSVNSLSPTKKIPPDIVQYGSIRKDCFSSLLPGLSNQCCWKRAFSLLMRKIGKMWSHWGLTKSLWNKFIHFACDFCITLEDFSDRHRKNVNKTGLILGESQCGHLPSWARGVIDWPLFLCETLVLHKKQTRSRELLVKIMNTRKPRTVTLRISSDFSKGKYAILICLNVSRIDFSFWSHDWRDHQFLKLNNA